MPWCNHICSPPSWCLYWNGGVCHHHIWMADVLMCVHCADSLGTFDFKQHCTEWSVYDIMLSNRSRSTFMSYTDHSVPIDMIESKRHGPRVWPSKKLKFSKINHYFYFDIAKIAPCRKKIYKIRSNNEKVAKFGHKIPKLSTLLLSQLTQGGSKVRRPCQSTIVGAAFFRVTSHRQEAENWLIWKRGYYF